MATSRYDMYQHNRLSICDVGQIEFVYVCVDLVS